MKNHVPSVALLYGLGCFSTPALAAPDSPTPPAEVSPAPLVRFDVEVDPLAYVALGHSLHVGLSVARFRFDIGTFSATVPEFLHRQPGFDNVMSGYGAKLDVFVWQVDRGPFVGVEGAWIREQIRDDSTHIETRTQSWIAGGRLGWHFALPAHFYIKPWVGVGYRFGRESVTVGKRVFHQTPLSLFPTFHVGYVFE